MGLRYLIVVDNPKTWPLEVPGVPLVSARAYLTEPTYSDLRGVKIFNLCKSYRYQSAGYYVSLLAMARGHKPVPSITTIQDMKSAGVARTVAGDLDELIERSLKRISSSSFVLSVYFGKNLAQKYEELSSRLFRLFQAPLLQAEFRNLKDGWMLHSVRPISASEIPSNHRDFAIEAAREFFARSRFPSHRPKATQYELAILSNPDEEHSPSDKAALQHFAAAAKRLAFGVEFITRDDYGRLAEFDALFIRETTAVNHYTYRFARRAAAEGLVVIDDPESIVRCCNKVYLAETLQLHKVPTPRTMILHRDNWEAAPGALGFPVILKQPDSSFSQGVVKADDAQQLAEQMEGLLERSELIIAQEFVPTDFDWRIGVLGREPLFACRYHMVKEHWQIARTDASKTTYGGADVVPIDQVPGPVMKAALRAASLVGDGFYGVDAKIHGNRVMVMEVNDNPNVDSGVEDRILGTALYDRIMQYFVDRIRHTRNGGQTES